MKRKTKNVLKTTALAVLGLGAIVGGASLINNMKGEDDGLKTIHPTFEVGGLNDADGKYEESKKTIYTKNAFECLGLEIEVDFDNNIKYQVFYYEADGDYISASQVLEGNQDLEVPLMATHARMEITPIWNDDVKEKDQEIKWYQVAKYATQLDIKVDEEQKWVDPMSINKFEIDNEKVEYMIDSVSKQSVGTELSLTQSSASGTLGTSKFVSVKDCSKLQVKSFNGTFDAWNYAFIDDNGNFVSGGQLIDYEVIDDVAILEIEIPSGATQFAFTYRQGNAYGIYCA